MQVHTTLSEVGALPVITVEGAIDFASIGTLSDDLGIFCALPALRVRLERTRLDQALAVRSAITPP